MSELTKASQKLVKAAQDYEDICHVNETEMAAWSEDEKGIAGATQLRVDAESINALVQSKAYTRTSQS